MVERHFKLIGQKVCHKSEHLTFNNGLNEQTDNPFIYS